MDILNDISRDNLLHFLSCYTEQVFQIILQNLTDFQNESITTFGACANFGHSTSEPVMLFLNLFKNKVFPTVKKIKCD
jgi:hypothetical protein